MKRGILLVSLLVLVVGLLSGCQSEEQARRQRMLDTSINAVQADINNFYLLGSLPTLDRIHSTMERLTTDWTRVEGIAKSAGGADISKASAAHADLAQTVAGLSKDVDGKLAMMTVMPKLEAFKAAVAEYDKASGFSD